MYVNEALLSVANPPTGMPGYNPIGPPIAVIGQKGGLNSVALGGNHDERRFGQFSLTIDF